MQITYPDSIPEARPRSRPFGHMPIDKALARVLDGEVPVVAFTDRKVKSVHTIRQRVDKRIRAATWNGHPDAKSKLKVTQRAHMSTIYVSKL